MYKTTVKTILKASAAVALLHLPSIATPSFAQQANGPTGQTGGPPKIEGWQIDVGVGSIIGPEYMGAKDYRVMVIPYVDIRYGENFFLNVPKGLGAYAINTGKPWKSLKVGFSIAPNFMNRDAEDFPGLSPVKMEIEARAFAEMKLGSITLDVMTAKGLGNGHGGLYTDVTVGYGKRIGSDGFFKISASSRYGFGRYMSAFYHVSPLDRLNSGLSAYQLDSGFERLSLRGLYAHTITEKWRASIIVTGNHLLGSAADSPIVDQKSSVTTITALTYRF